jgi:hypothetical protein
MSSAIPMGGLSMSSRQNAQPGSILAIAVLLSVQLTLAQDQQLPKLATNDHNLDQAFAIALADVKGNIHAYKAGLLDSTRPVLMAGAGYDTPWTRDAAINTWNGAGLLWPEIARSTLLSVLERQEGQLVIGGQYWDAILWTTGAWNYYLFTGDRGFLSDAIVATRNTLAKRETQEFDRAGGLFRGPEVYGDGVAAYPDRYAETGGSSAILDWPKHNPQHTSSPGRGLPMLTLSTNCTYVHAYELMEKMATTLGLPVDPAWAQKAAALRRAIEQNFWSRDLGRYIALVDYAGTDDRQEAIGLAFSVLFDVASPDHQASLFRHAVVTPAGMASLWPTYPRYSARGGFGRHSGYVWPHAQAFWADAAAVSGHPDLFSYELTQLAEKAVRDGQFYELYNPVSGQPDGGLQELEGRGIVAWQSQPHQTWSATGYLRLILFDLAGMHFDQGGIEFAPFLPKDIHEVKLTGIRYRDAVLDVHARGSGSHVVNVTINGAAISDHRLSAAASGAQHVEITVTQ